MTEEGQSLDGLMNVIHKTMFDFYANLYMNVRACGSECGTFAFLQTSSALSQFYEEMLRQVLNQREWSEENVDHGVVP
jgi:hypothetical protein